ncbi:MAG: flagellar basal body-associated FliL family protein [Thioalkalispiraceae bacterium]|jgi:flagellar FliL protein
MRDLLFNTCISVLLLFGSTTLCQAAGGNSGSPYFEIAKPFVVNLADKGRTAFLQVKAQFKVKNQELKDQLYNNLPAIQHSIMMVLSEQTSTDIKSVAGKQKLREKTLQEVQAFLMNQLGDPVVDEIYFTGFIIQ